VGSPFHQAADAGARVLMIGCEMTACSLVHVAEAIVRVPYLGKVCHAGYDKTLTLVDEAGLRTPVPPRDVPTDSASFTVVQEALEAGGRLARCRPGSAECLGFRARTCLDAAVELLRADPAALLCRNPRCPVCPKARAIIQREGGADDRRDRC
jgi:aminoglycoside N3'-acetyltransferase